MVANNGLGIYGVGYNSGGKYATAFPGGKRTPEYITWRSILMRCYSKKHHTTQVNGRTYKDSYVCDEWKDFQVFAEWFCNNKIDRWEVDKDILSKGNECYCPELCRFVPPELNSQYKKAWKRKEDQEGMPLGVYKIVQKKSCKYSIPATLASRYSVSQTYSTMEEAHSVYKRLKANALCEILDRHEVGLPEDITQGVREDIKNLLKN